MTDPVTDYSLVYALASFMIFLLFIFGLLLTWVKLGGWPEGTYRMARIDYFSAIFIDAQGTPRRFPIKSKELKTGDNTLPPSFKFTGFANAIGQYFTNPAQATRHNGRPSWYYYPDNPFPIPLRDLKNPLHINASQLEKAFNNDTMTEFLGIGKPEPKKKSRVRWLYLALGLFSFFLIIGLIYSLGVKP